MSAANHGMPGRTSPYQGLVPYGEDDTSWFFGRDELRDIVIDSLSAYHVTVLYGESGVGKSSLLRAAVAPRLREHTALSSPVDVAGPPVVVVFSQWAGEDPLRDLKQSISDAAGGSRQTTRDESADRSLLEVARSCAGDPARWIVVILDQLEQFFLYHATDPKGHDFEVDLAAAIADPERTANFLLSIREDALAHLGRLQRRVPSVLDNLLRVDHLDDAAAREAITCPLRRWHSETGEHITVEPGLTDAVLADVRVGNALLPSSAGTGRVSAAVAADRIEAPYLQLVLVRLWEEERSAASNAMRLTTLSRLGGAESIVRAHLDRVLDSLTDEELQAALAIFRNLVTPSGAAIAHTARDLATLAAQPTPVVDRILDRFDAARIVRVVDPAPLTGEPRYAIFHDRLAGPLLEWIANRDRRRLYLEARAERRRANAFRALAVAAIALLILAVVAGLLAERQTARATSARHAAESIQLAASSQAVIDRDTELSALLARQGAMVRATPQAIQALRTALSDLREVASIRVGLPVDDATFSPRGDVILTTTEGVPPRWTGRADLWSVSSHRRLATLSEPERNYAITSAAFSPTGEQIVTADQGGVARVWSAHTYRLLGVIREPPNDGNDAITSVRYSPSGRAIITASQDGAARVWSANMFRQLGAMTEPGANHDTAMTSAVFSPDGSQIVTASADGTVRIWSPRTYRQLRALPTPSQAQNASGLTNGLTNVSFSPDGHSLVAAGTDGTALVWRTSDFDLVAVLAEPASINYGVASASFSRDSRYILTTSFDGTARLWSATHYRQVAVLAAHTGAVTAGAFSRDGRLVLTAGADGTVKLWTTLPPEEVGVLGAESARESASTHVAFSPNGRMIVTTNDSRTARIWNAGTYQLQATLTEPSRDPLSSGGIGTIISDAQFSPDSRLIVTADDSGNVRIWSATTGRQLTAMFTAARPPGANLAIATASFSPDGGEVVTADDSGAVRLWSVSSRRTIASFVPPPRSASSEVQINKAAFSADGQEIIGAGSDGVARMWNVRNRTLERTFIEPSHRNLVSAAFSPNGSQVVTASDDGTARIWDARSGKVLEVITEPQYAGLSIAAFSPNGQYVVTASFDNTTRIWSARTRQELITMTAEDAAMSDAAFSPDGTKIVTADGDDFTRVWSLELAGNLSALETIARRRLIRPLTPAERQAYGVG